MASAPSFFTQATDSGREALAVTRRRASFLASWMAIEPTPPAPPRISSRLPSWPPVFEIPRRSNSPSQAVMVVSGSAAASAKESLRGFAPTMRSSTRCSSLFVPGRWLLPA